LLLSRSAPQTGTRKSQFESAQKTTALGANQEIFGFDWGEAAECTAILRGIVEEIKTKMAGTSPAIETA
jgi:hypothetical protein